MPLCCLLPAGCASTCELPTLKTVTAWRGPVAQAVRGARCRRARARSLRRVIAGTLRRWGFETGPARSNLSTRCRRARSGRSLWRITVVEFAVGLSMTSALLGKGEGSDNGRVPSRDFRSRAALVNSPLRAKLCWWSYKVASLVVKYKRCVRPLRSIRAIGSQESAIITIFSCTAVCIWQRYYSFHVTEDRAPLYMQILLTALQALKSARCTTAESCRGTLLSHESRECSHSVRQSGGDLSIFVAWRPSLPISLAAPQLPR